MPLTIVEYCRRPTRRLLATWLIALSASAAGGAIWAAERAYVGGEVCGGCHTEQRVLWRGSHHDLAMQEANAETVLGDFNDATHVSDELVSRFFRRDGKFLVRTDGADGKLADFQVKYTFGVAPLQQYLIEFPGGRLQALGIAWDARPAAKGGQKWFHLYPRRSMRSDDPLHWTGANQNWNYMCAGCHSTNVDKNYQPAQQRYATDWSEIDVSCEACHGPGSKHVEWAKQRAENVGEQPDQAPTQPDLSVELDDRLPWRIEPGTGIARARGSLSRPPQQVETCGRCHSRSSVLWEDYRHGRPLLDTRQPAILSQGLYYADGQIQDEVYVYGSFLQSRMYRAGVTCSDCHDPHSLELRATGNALCLRCHSAPRYDTAQHHHHAPDTDAGQCVTCHMPQRTFMVIDPRADHSLRIPQPALSEKTGSPNVCVGCHTGRSNKWAALRIEQWSKPAAAQRAPHFGEAIVAGRRGTLDAAERLAGLVQNLEQPAIARATAASLIRGYPSPATASALSIALQDSDPLVRLSALEGLAGFSPDDQRALAAPLLDDPLRVVRMEAARLLAASRGELSSQDRERLVEALAEYERAQLYNADRAEAHLNLGSLRARQGDLDGAQRAYRQAIEIDPGYAPAYVNLSDLYRATGRDGEGERLLKRALDKLPDAAPLWHAYGLLQIRQKKRASGQQSLRKAMDLDARNIRYRYIYAVALQSAGKLDEALRILEQAHAMRPADRDVLYGLVSFLGQAGRHEEARQHARTLVRVSPWDRTAQDLLRRLDAAAERAK